MAAGALVTLFADGIRKKSSTWNPYWIPSSTTKNGKCASSGLKSFCAGLSMKTEWEYLARGGLFAHNEKIMG